MDYNFELILFVSMHFLVYQSESARLKDIKKKAKELTEYLAVVDACHIKQKLITSDRNEEFELVETFINTTLTLACHFCDDKDDDVPKLWYRQSRYRNSNIVEVELGMEDELSSNRVYMKPDHTLVFNRTIEEDAALYYCSAHLGKDQNFKYNYLVDIVNASAAKVTIGNLKDWTAFEEKSFTEINNKFTTSNRSDYEDIRSKDILVEVIGRWQAWGTCDGCRKIRIKIAECRLQPSIKSKNITWKYSLNDGESFLMKSFEMSCYSTGLQKLYPNISNDLLEIGNFAITEHCYAPCKVYSESKSSAQYRNTIILAEGDHFTLICPEVNPKSEVVWEKNGVAISPNIRGGNLLIDSFSNLYIITASSDEEANYTCFVDDVKMQVVSVFVRQKLVITSDDFFRHFKYLGFIFLFSGIFYSAGMILAWNRRHTFKKVDFTKVAEERFVHYLDFNPSNTY
ncbi:unnamed protein product [Nezara viridula]|uniref:Ig-like domain-containing protein n=1 Tax=Nezara viridula TaxID=85310 RepID=A0A9P0DXP7_NEZVI|nr:unnamed protein product [Nezara viridula]